MTKLREQLIQIFNALADVESMKNRFYPSKAFRSVADALQSCDRYSISDGRVIIKNSTTGFTKVLGNSSSEVFIEFLNCGTCSRLDSEPLYKSDLGNITGIGDMRKFELIKAGITTIKDLENLNLKIGDAIPGTSLTFSQQMSTGLKIWNRTHGVRISREQAKEYIDDFKRNVTSKIYVLGSFRRMKPTIGDIDIVIIKDGTNYSFLIIKWLDEIFVQGESKISGIKGNTQVDIRIIDEKYLGAHILHATGSQEFNIKLRAHAKSLGMKLNEYGITDSNGTFHTFKSEIEVFNFLGVKYVPPEMR